MKLFKLATRLLAVLLITASLTLAAPLEARAAAPGGSITVTVKAPTTAAMLLVAGDPTITSVMVVNNGSVTAFLGGSAVTATTGTPVFANTKVVFNDISSPLYGITSASTANLRITVVRGGGSIEMDRLTTTGISNAGAANTIPMSNGADLVAGNVLIYNLSTAITANSTSTATAAGTLAVTSNATGIGKIFRSDGSLWQLLSAYSDFAHQSDTVTIATTGNTDAYIVTTYAATLTSLDCSGIDALTANDSNYITATLTNLGQAGSGTNPMLAATDPNTSKATGGTGFAANTKRAFTVNGTGSNLIVAAGDRLRLRLAATGTLANSITGTKCVARFTRLS